MAVTLESGSYVKFQYNLGTGPIDIINWAVKVRPGYWYTAYATRSVECFLCDVSSHSWCFQTMRFLSCQCILAGKRVIVLNN